MIPLANFYQFFKLESIQWDVLINATLSSTAIPTSQNSADYIPANPTNSTGVAGGLASNLNLNNNNNNNTNKNGDNTNYNFKNNDVNYQPNDPEDEFVDWGDKDLPHPVLLVMDIACLIYFTVEYMTRFLCSPNKKDFLRALQNIVDFLAFAPDYVELIFLVADPGQGEGVHIMEMFFILRILRLFRIFRLIRHVPGLWILLYTLKASFNELMLMCVFLLIGMVVFATLIHFVEPDGEFDNIPVGFWWSVVTMTTVGYGDMFPTTAGGYIIGSCCAVAGLLMIAFTVPIIVSNFVLYYTHVQYGLARKDREAERQMMGSLEGEIEVEADAAAEGGKEEKTKDKTNSKKKGGGEGATPKGGLRKDKDDGEEYSDIHEEDLDCISVEGQRTGDGDKKSSKKRKENKKKTKKKLGGGKVNAKDDIESQQQIGFDDKLVGLDVEAPPLTTTRNGNSYFGVRDLDMVEMREHDHGV